MPQTYPSETPREAGRTRAARRSLLVAVWVCCLMLAASSAPPLHAIPINYELAGQFGDAASPLDGLSFSVSFTILDPAAFRVFSGIIQWPDIPGTVSVKSLGSTSESVEFRLLDQNTFGAVFDFGFPQPDDRLVFTWAGPQLWNQDFSDAQLFFGEFTIEGGTAALGEPRQAPTFLIPFDATLNVSEVPEPSTFTLLLSGALAGIGLRWRKSLRRRSG